MMKSVWFYLLCFIVVTSCNNNEVRNKVEDNIQLDSTILALTVVADSIQVPWDLTWGPDNKLWFNEQNGSIYELAPETGKKKLLLKIPDVWMKRTAGLLGMAFFNGGNDSLYLFVAYTGKPAKNVVSKLVRYTYKNNQLVEPKLLLEIPGGNGHNGSRIEISDDRKLFWATGDAQNFDNAQDSTRLNGKILRLNFDGTIPEDNPIKNSFVFAWGFRNIQGLALTNNGNLFVSEHGDAIEDEINLVKPLKNYGWPVIEGMHDKPDEISYAKTHLTTEPVKSWTPTIAPSGMAFYNNDQIPEWENSLLLANLKDRSLRVLKLNNADTSITDEQIFIQQKYGRLRDVCVSPAGDVYISTSNRDWNPYNHPAANDDRILKISKVKKAVKTPMKGIAPGSGSVMMNNGRDLYKIYCASCHQNDGGGAASTFPALKGSLLVTGSKDSLIKLYLHGTRDKTKSAQMPAFKFLSPEESVLILNFIRTNWGNQADSITVADVEKRVKISAKK